MRKFRSLQLGALVAAVGLLCLDPANAQEPKSAHKPVP